MARWSSAAAMTSCSRSAGAIASCTIASMASRAISLLTLARTRLRSRPDLGDVGTQTLRLAQVDVLNRGALAIALHVQQHTNTARHGARHRNLLGAEEGDVEPTHRARRHS